MVYFVDKSRQEWIFFRWGWWRHNN